MIKLDFIFRYVIIFANSVCVYYLAYVCVAAADEWFSNRKVDMNRLKLTVIWMMLALVTIFSSGCALISTALSAAAAYGIYQATRD